MIVIGVGGLVAPLKALAQRPLGIDVSSYQGSADSPPTNIVWTKVKSAGIAFAWAKATEGLTYRDADFVYNVTNAKSAGVPIGAYHFAHPDTHPGTSGADQEAAFFLSIAGPYIKSGGGYLVPMLDAEVASPGTQSAVSAWVNEWCQDIVNYGNSNGIVLTPVVYTYQSWASSYLNSTVTQWPLWMASPNGQNPQTGNPSGTTPWATWTLWQYGGGTVSGLENAVDEDVFDGTATGLTNTLMIGFLTPPPPSGVTNNWDPAFADASPGSGGSGTWDNSTTNWWHSGSGDIAWSTGGDYAVFAGTAGTVTLGASVGADRMTFNTAGYTVGGSGTITLSGTTPVISVPAGSPTYISCVLGGSGYQLTGGGILVLENAGNYCGSSSSPEYVIGPNTTLVVLTDHDTGNDGVTLNLESGGIYQDNDATGGDQFLLPGCAIGLLTGGGIFDNPNANLTMTNFITGSGSLTTIGTTYTLTLTDTGNNYTGGTIVQSGTLKANAAGTLGSTSGALTVSGGTLDLGGATHTAGAVTISSGTIQNGTLTGSSYAGQGGTESTNAVLAGSKPLTKTTTNSLTLSGTNTYTGITTISGGLLVISADYNLGAAPASPVANQLTMNTGITGNTGLRVTKTFTMSANRGITLGASGGAIQVSTGNTLTYNGIITGSGAFEEGTSTTVGEGTIVLGGANSYAGSTTIACGTLRLGADGALPFGTPLTVASAAVGGTFDLNGHATTIGPLASSTGIGGIGTVTPTVLLTGALTMLETNNTTFNGNISGSGGSLTISGNSTLTLNGTNTYSGPTIISAGTLALGGTGSINNSSSITVGAGATFDVSSIPSYTLSGSTTFNAAGNSVPATINGGTTVGLGSRPIVLTYDGSHTALTISQGTLSLNGNAFTINGPVLMPGTYTVIQQASGNVASSGAFSVSGTAIGAGGTGSISVSGGNVNLVILPTPSFGNLTPSQSATYGTPAIMLTGKLSAGSIYPASGEAVSVSINGNLQMTTINDGTGDFSINYNLPGMPASGSAYTITYSYGGDASLNPASNSGTTLNLNPKPVALAGTRAYDGTATVVAGILSVTNKVGSDAVTVASGSGTLASANVGPEAITSVGTLTLGGAAAGNYTLTGATGLVAITVPPFSITSEYIDSTGTNFVLTWESAPGATYHIIGNTNTAAALSTWTNVSGPIVATGTNTSFTNPVTQSTSVFDVESP
jgi:autotransporter-associated beta strand protein